MGIKSFTPLDIRIDNLSGLKIGISISEPEESSLLEIGQTPSHLKYLSQDVGRHILAKKGVIIYGGDLREDGFTNFLISEAQALKARTNSEDVFIKNYLAWPVYLLDKEDVINWKAKYNSTLEMIEVPFEDDVKEVIPNINAFLPPDNTDNSFIWSRCLTKMRCELISDSDIRICAGGKYSGYKGKMPGVLEEIIISISQSKPIFLLGGFGGVCQSISKLLMSNHIPLQLNEVWQKENNAGYSDLLSKIRNEAPEYYPRYDKLLETITLDKLKNGLDKKENETLFQTPFIDEALHLIFLGISRLNLEAKTLEDN